MAIINGWGRGTWGEGAWGEALPLTLTAPSAATSALGTVTPVADATVTLTGLSATATNGGVAVEAGGEVGVNGLAANSALGTATTVSNNTLNVTGLVGTTGFSAPGVNAQAVASVPGLNSSVGAVSVDVDGEANVAVTGVAGTSAIGTASTITDNRFNVGELVNQMVANDPFVNPTVNAACNFTITGVSATGELGHVFKWQDIDESQTPNWTDVAA